MNGYRRGLSGPSLGHDADKDLILLVWIVVAIVIALNALNWAFPVKDSEARQDTVEVSPE